MKTTFIGIDVSSATLDIAVKQGSVESFKIKNERGAISKFFKKFNDSSTVVAMENTGRYNWTLYEVMADLKCSVYVLNALHLKKSMGLLRDKNDKVDAIRICNYIQKNYMDERIWEPSTPSIRTLKVLLSERISRVKEKKRIQSQIHSLKTIKRNDTGIDLVAMRQKRIKEVNAELKQLDKAIEALINSDVKLKAQKKLIKTVPGVGNVIAWTMIAKTEAFTRIKEARKMGCYAGVVPFQQQSGTSIRSKNKVSVYADKSLKSLLHLGAMSAIRLENDLGAYYRRKVSQGKNKMSALNAVRNKIIHRIFAVIKHEKEYNKKLLVS